MKQKIIYITVMIALIFGVFGVAAINEVLIFDATTGSNWVNHTWVVTGDPPHAVIGTYIVHPEGQPSFTLPTNTPFWKDVNITDNWSNVTVSAMAMFGGTQICQNDTQVWIPTPYAPEPIPFSLWVSLLAFGAVISIIACVYIKNIVISLPLGAIGVVSFIFGGYAVTTNGIDFYSGGATVATVSDVLVSQIVMLFAIFPMLIAIISVVQTVYTVLDEREESKTSEFDDQWG